MLGFNKKLLKKARLFLLNLSHLIFLSNCCRIPLKPTKKVKWTQFSNADFYDIIISVPKENNPQNKHFLEQKSYTNIHNEFHPTIIPLPFETTPVGSHFSAALFSRNNAPQNKSRKKNIGTQLTYSVIKFSEFVNPSCDSGVATMWRVCNKRAICRGGAAADTSPTRYLAASNYRVVAAVELTKLFWWFINDTTL